jgi:hypothetical protein
MAIFRAGVVDRLQSATDYHEPISMRQIAGLNYFQRSGKLRIGFQPARNRKTFS